MKNLFIAFTMVLGVLSSTTNAFGAPMDNAPSLVSGGPVMPKFGDPSKWQLISSKLIQINLGEYALQCSYKLKPSTSNPTLKKGYGYVSDVSIGNHVEIVMLTKTSHCPTLY